MHTAADAAKEAGGTALSGRRWPIMRLLRSTLLASSLVMAGCAGSGPLGEPAKGVAGLKAAEQQHETAKMGQAPATPRAGGSPIAPTGPEGDPTVGPSDQVGPH